MSDIATIWNNTTGRGDYVLAGADLQSGNDLETEILISLFSDRTARPDDVIPDGSNDRRGWWADENLGSRLWLLERSKLTNAVGQKAVEYAAEGLQWLIDDGVVAGFDITFQIVLPDRLYLTIQAFKIFNGVKAPNYAWVWTGLALGGS